MFLTILNDSDVREILTSLGFAWIYYAHFWQALKYLLIIREDV